MDTIQLKVSPRELTGKKVKTLRRQGLTPIHLYGRGIQPANLQGETPTLQRIIAQAGKNILVSLEVEGQGDQNVAFIREIQRHPITGDLLHVDFLRIDVRERIQADVPLVLVGEAPAVRTHRGFLFQAMHSLRVECLPMDVPEAIEVDVSGLHDFEKAVRVEDLSVNPSVAVLSEPDVLIARVNQPRLRDIEEEAAIVSEEEAAPEEAAVAGEEEEEA